MRTIDRHILHRFFPLLLLVALQACAPLPPDGGGRYPADEVIGTLYTQGPNVWLNQKRAGNETRVYVGDRVSTGGDSTAVIKLVDGGIIQLDENTDPGFFKKIFGEGYCVLVRYFYKGRIYADSDKMCFETDGLDAFMGSRINLEVLPNNKTVLTVLKGRVTINRPQKYTLREGNQALVSSSKIERVRALSEEELRSTVRWIEKFDLGEPQAPGWEVSYFDNILRIIANIIRPPSDGQKQDRLEAARRRCEEYSRRAVRQNEENLAGRCGFTGPRWHSNYKVHYGWCLNVTQEIANSEEAARAEDIKNRCRSTQGLSHGKTPRQSSIETDTDRPDRDYRSFDITDPDASPETCKKACLADSRCRAWTFGRAGIGGPRPRCWLKSDVPPPVRKSGCVSGVVR